MKRIILVVVILAVVGIFAYKFVGDRTQVTNTNVAVTNTVAPVTSSTAPSTQTATDNLKVFYLFHNPKDQDPECRVIYVYADVVERDLSGRVKVLRPDVKTETALVEKYRVKVLPTILITSPDGTEQERFEGEGEKVSSRIEDAIAKLKESK